jgi:hypothetical protein
VCEGPWLFFEEKGEQRARKYGKHWQKRISKPVKTSDNSLQDKYNAPQYYQPSCPQPFTALTEISALISIRSTQMKTKQNGINKIKI